MRQTRAESGLGAKETSNTPKTGGRRARKPLLNGAGDSRNPNDGGGSFSYLRNHKSLPASGIPDSVLLHGTNPANQ